MQSQIERRALSPRRWVRRTARAVGNARLFERGWRYAARELSGRRVAAPYRLRSGSIVHLRHPDVDDWIVWEVFNLRMYEPPAPVAAHLARIPRPQILDLGAHVGLFGRYMLDAIAGADVTSVEPSIASVDLLRRTAGVEPGRWQVIAAAAATSAGHARLTVPADGRLHFGALSTEGQCQVRTIDVFPLFAVTDLAKIDIEGAEWPILSDPRFHRDRVPPVLVIEYHPCCAPHPSPRAALVKVLSAAAQYTHLSFVQGTDAQGVVWAWDATRLLS